jgi:hypothetical protein
MRSGPARAVRMKIAAARRAAPTTRWPGRSAARARFRRGELDRRGTGAHGHCAEDRCSAGVFLASRMACPAKAEEAQFVIDHAKLARVPHPAAEASELVGRNGAARQVLDAPAPLANQVVVVTEIGLPEFIPGPPGGGIRGSDQPESHEQVHRSIDRHEVDAVGAHAGMDLPHGHRRTSLAKRFEDKAARGGETMSSPGKHL